MEPIRKCSKHDLLIRPIKTTLKVGGIRAKRDAARQKVDLWSMRIQKIVISTYKRKRPISRTRKGPLPKDKNIPLSTATWGWYGAAGKEGRLHSGSLLSVTETQCLFTES